MTPSDKIALLGVIISLFALLSTLIQWYRVTRCVEMVSNSDSGSKILPAWFTKRMMNDSWVYGLLTNGEEIIERVNKIADDQKWIDVTLITKGSWNLDENPNYIYAVDQNRTDATINTSLIVMAYEIISS